MRKFPSFLACLLTAILLTTATGLASQSAAIGIIGGADGPTAVYVADSSSGGSGSASRDDMPEEGDMAEDLFPEEGEIEEDNPSPSPSPTPVPTAAPVENADFTISVDLGYDGLVILNQWCPAFVTIENHSADFDGLLGVNAFYSLTEFDRYEIPLTIAGGSTKQVELPFTPMTRQDMYAFELTQNGTLVAEERIAPSRLASPEILAIGVLSENPESLAYFAQRANGADTLRGEVWMPVALNADTFPGTANLMSAFSMLVVDGIDARTLSDAQREALTAWLLGGGTVFVSGGAKAATGYPFFSQWTELTGGKPVEGTDISALLLEYAQIKGTPTGETVWINELADAGALIDDGTGHGLLFLSRAGSGNIFSAAFDIGGKPLDAWASMSSIWPRVMRESMTREYQQMLDRLDSSMYGNGNYYSAQSLISQMRLDSPDSGLPVLLILAVYLLLVGCAGYLLLKKIDRREWLWAGVPVAAVVFAGLLFLLSGGTTMNKPAALTASRITLDGADAQVMTFVGVATPDSGELLIETDKNQLPTVLKSDNYWYEDSAQQDRLYRPLSMRQRYRLGASPAVGFVGNESWDARLLQLSGLEESMGSLDVEMWMEADGLHGKATNNTEEKMNGCIAVTSFGYSTVGDILPGQSVSFEMLYPKKPLVIGGNGEEKYEPNILYSTLDIDLSSAGTSYYNPGFYTYLNAATYGNMSERPDPVAEHRHYLVQLFENEWMFYQNRFYFFAFNENLGQVSVTLNGKAVDRTAHTAVVGTSIDFEPIGPTGQVMYPQGFIPGEVVVDEGEDKKPRLPTDADGERSGDNMYGEGVEYLNLSAPVALRYVLPDHEKYIISKMSLLGSTYETMPDVYLYNNETDEWDLQLLLSVIMDGENWAPYIDKEGAIYVRYVPAASANRYEGMQMPSISLRGEVK